MTKDATKEAIAVMQAYVDGKRIEFNDSLTQLGSEWLSVEEPNWYWSIYNYRIAPEPAYRPYNSPSEVPIGARVRCKHSGATHMIWDAVFWDPDKQSAIRVDTVNPHGYRGIGAATLFADYEFLGGKPCGVLEGGAK